MKRLLVAALGMAIVGAACDRGASDRHSTEPAHAIEAAPVAVEVPSSPTIEHQPDPVPASVVERAPELPRPTSAACLANTGSTTAAQARSVHRWVDSAGITHYSDRLPPDSALGHRVIDVRQAEPITVLASGHDSNLPDELQRRAVTDALGVQRVMRESLGVQPPAGVVLRVVFIKDGETYGRLIGSPALAGSAGAYSTAQRTIFVRRQDMEEANFSVLRHEITHALVHESIGNLPTPINEGMAEYFGRYRVAGLGGQIEIGVGGAAIVAAAPTGDNADALVDLLARDGDAFYAMDGGATREARYMRAYSLVAVLMRDDAGRKALAAVLATQRADACRPVAAERILASEYPGGLPALADAWSAFMRRPENDIRAY